MANDLTRRHFLKNASFAAASVPLSTVAAQAETGAILPQIYTLLLSDKRPANKRNKVVFISDIHMNVDANYSWMVLHAPHFTKFLKEINKRDDVSELVILGDLVDDWVNPIADSPQSFSDVLTAGNNSTIVPALQEICANTDIKVTYVVGNHDMLSFETPNRNILTSTFPGMEIISDSPGLGAYSKDNIIWAEHGHRYCLFNAPDTWSRPSVGHLPMGYFISRLAATRAVKDGVVTTTPDLLDEYVDKHLELSNGLFDDLLILAIFNGIALWSGSNPAVDKFIMAGKDAYIPDPLIEQVALTYDTIFSNWPLCQDRVSNVEAVWNDVGSLSSLCSAANLLFEMPGYLTDKYPFTPRIVLFGHTHKAAFHYHPGDDATLYVNTGTWIDGKDMTWVEIEINDIPNDKKSYEVSLWYNEETSPRQSATITAASSFTK